MHSIMGEHEVALRTFESMGLDTETAAPVRAVRYLYEPVCIQKAFLSRTLLCIGRLDSALEESGGALERASRLGHLPTQFVVLIQGAMLVPLWTGQAETAARAVHLCTENAGDDRSRKQYARLYAGCLEIKQGDAAAGVRALRDEILAPTFDINTLAPSQAVFYTALAEGLYRVRDFAAARALADLALARSAASGGVWFDPELLRLEACALAAEGAPVAAVEQQFEKSLLLARQHGALYWELRAALAQASYWASLQRVAEAHALLQPVYARFSQGSKLPDLVSARELLGQLRA